MGDAYLEWSSDLSLAPNGDLELVDGPDETRQRIERRLFTSVRGYIWHQSYGAGLYERVGKPARAANIQALVRAQMLLESTVARTPPPRVTVAESQALGGLFTIDIRYTDAVSGSVAEAIRLEIPSNQ